MGRETLNLPELDPGSRNLPIIRSTTGQTRALSGLPLQDSALARSPDDPSRFDLSPRGFLVAGHDLKHSLVVITIDLAIFETGSFRSVS